MLHEVPISPRRAFVDANAIRVEAVRAWAPAAVSNGAAHICSKVRGPDIDGPIHGYFGRPIDEIPAPTLGVVPKGDIL